MVRQNGHEGVVTVAMWVVNPRHMREGYGSLSVCVCVCACACVCVRVCSYVCSRRTKETAMDSFQEN